MLFNCKRYLGIFLLLSLSSFGESVTLNTGGAPTWRYSVNTAASLPVIGNVTGDVILVLDTNILYSWNGVSWSIPGGGGGSSAWGTITGSLASQLDLAAALAAKQDVGPFKAPYATITDPPFYGHGGGDNDSGIFTTGDGNDSIVENGVLKASFDQNTIDFYSVSGTTVHGDLTATGNFSAANYPPTASANTPAVYGSSGVLQSWVDHYLTSENGAGSNSSLAATDSGSRSYDQSNIAVRPTENSPSYSLINTSRTIDIDPDSTGFTLGTGGQFATFDNLYFRHQGTSNTGSLNFHQFSSDIGNGTDPISVNGVSFIQGNGHIYNNVTMTGPLQGYGFQYVADAGSGITQETRVFYDFSNLNTSLAGYVFGRANANVDRIKNNSNYDVLTSTPNIGELMGNANFTGISLRPRVTTINSGHFNMLDLRPELLSGTSDNNTIMSIDASQIPGINNRAAQFTGDVDVQGSLTFSGALSIGKLNAFATQDVVDGGGNPSSVNSLIAAINVPASATIANGDTFGINTAALISAGANSTVTSGPLGLGLTGLALPAVVEMGLFSNIDNVGGAVFAISLSGGATGGTIHQGYGGRAIGIPNGITTVDRWYGLWSQNPFGSMGTQSWASYFEDDPNFMEKALKIGGSDLVSQAHMDIETEQTIAAKGGTQLSTSGSQPTCDAAHRGLLWNIEGGTGVADILQICQKNAADVYVWITK
jgi:hypothetical protein